MVDFAEHDLFCFVLFCFVFVWKNFKKEKRENERKKRVEIFARFRVENILLHRQTSILFVLLVCVFVLLFLCFAFVILLNAKNHVVFALVFVAVFFAERGCMDAVLRCCRAKPAGQGSILI